MVHALRLIHAALLPDGELVDTQPVSAEPPVLASGRPVGSIDMRQWIRTIEAVDEAVGETVRGGLYSLLDERRFVVLDSWDSGEDCASTVRTWQGARVSAELASRIAAARPPLTVHQEVRLRLLRAMRP